MLVFDQILVQIVNGLVNGMILALVASGLTLIFGIMDIVNFAHGDLFMLGAYLRHREDLTPDLERVFELFPVLLERRGQAGGTLSGGEQQMLAIARVMMLEPRIILLDEPTEGLMPRMVSQIREIIEVLHKEGVAILLVEQNVPLTLGVAERVYIMEKGMVRHHAPATALRADASVIHQYLGV